MISRVSPAFLQQFLAIEPFHNFALLRTDGDGTSPPPCSKFLSQYICCRAVTDTLHPCFMHAEKRNVEKSSIPVSVNDVFFIFFCFINNLPDSLR